MRAQPTFLSDLSVQALSQSDGTEVCGPQAAINSRAVDQPPGPRVESSWSPSLVGKALLSNPFVKSIFSCPVGFFWCMAQAFFCRLKDPSVSLLQFQTSQPFCTYTCPLISFLPCQNWLVSFFAWLLSVWDVLNTRLNTGRFTSAGERALHGYFPSPLSVWCPLHSNRALNLPYTIYLSHSFFL